MTRRSRRFRAAFERDTYEDVYGGDHGQESWIGKGINPIRIYRDKHRAKIAGVCAGIARYLDIKVSMVRLAFIIGVFVFSPVIPIAYVILAFVLKPMPERLFKSPNEEHFWRSVMETPNRSVAELRGRFRALDRRLADIETRVTTPEYDLRQKFRDLNG